MGDRPTDASWRGGCPMGGLHPPASRITREDLVRLADFPDVGRVDDVGAVLEETQT
jgi:hypothetical protein